MDDGPRPVQRPPEAAPSPLAPSCRVRAECEVGFAEHFLLFYPLEEVPDAMKVPMVWMSDHWLFGSDSDRDLFHCWWEKATAGSFLLVLSPEQQFELVPTTDELVQ